jgi:hypothetical protein
MSGGWLVILTYCALIGTSPTPSCGVTLTTTMHPTKSDCENTAANQLAGLLEKPLEGHVYLYAGTHCEHAVFGAA